VILAIRDQKWHFLVPIKKKKMAQSAADRP
jgi:hypothetical protein